ncbi:MAG: peptidase T [Bacteroidota bacterium]
MEKLLPRFLEFVQVDTQSDPYSQTTPSTEKQRKLAKKLLVELHQIGMEDVTIDENCYIMATLPSNVEKKVPTIGFIAHMDTTPDFTGKKVKPNIVEAYDGGDIKLKGKKGMVLSPKEFPELEHYVGQTLVTTDGTTLLGADDKAGVSEIITAMEYLRKHPEIPHGKIRVAFTPDEEIGRGAHKFDVEKFDAEWAYTVDGSQVGELEFENFNAASAVIKCKGKSVHPGFAKDKMINALLVAHEFVSMLPLREVPEKTEGMDGFFHVHTLKGSVEKSKIELIIRDHDREHFEARKQLLLDIAEKLNDRYGKAVSVHMEDQYYNMREKVEPVYHIVEIAEEAMKSVGVEPIIKPIRGGTDGSQLSFMGLPCPNIFAGGHNFHGPYEYVPLESMQKAVEVIVKISELTARQIQ